VAKTLTLGDLVLINGLLIQLYIPLIFLGMVYREIKQALIDTDRMFRLLEENREIQDSPGATDLVAGSASIRFEGVDFSFDPKRQILFDVSFDVPAGTKVAVVGHSGAGKSTLARLLYRFYDVSRGASTSTAATSAHSDSRACAARSASCRRTGAVQRHHLLQHPVRPAGGDTREVIEAARAAHIPRVHRKPARPVRGAGGRARPEAVGRGKQRVAIARAILKNRPS